MNLKKNNISILCCWPGRPCSGEIYSTRGDKTNKRTSVYIYTTANGWVRVDSERRPKRAHNAQDSLPSLSIYDERFLARVPRVLPAFPREKKGRKVSMTDGAWVRSRAAVAAHCIYILVAKSHFILQELLLLLAVV